MQLPPTSALLTDLYQLTMMQGYFRQQMNETAVFEFFVRKLPRRRNFLVAAGLEQVIQYVQGLKFSMEELEWLRSCGYFESDFVDSLNGFRFTGDIHAMPEGTIFFPNEPILRITAPLPQAQLIETRVINILHYQTLIASKAARMKLAAPDRLLVDFGLRRAHGADSGLLAARASFLAGFSGTSTLLAGPEFDVPVYGTMAHSFVQAHAGEMEAFRHFAGSQPDHIVLLIDTYDTERAAEKIVGLAPELQKNGLVIQAVRLDSGDLAIHAGRVRKILDAGNLGDVKIFASGNLDEYALSELLEKQAPIDGFGIGTRLATSSDAPYLDCAYKLQEYAGIARRKHSEGKATWPGRKQVYRRYDKEGIMAGDILTIEGDRQEGEMLIRPFMQQGELIAPCPRLTASRDYAARQLMRLPAGLTRLDTQSSYPVTVSRELRRIANKTDEFISRQRNPDYS